MKKICIVTHDMYGGGCERVIAQLGNWLTNKNIDVTIITEVESPPFYFLDEKIKVISLLSKNKIKQAEILPVYLHLRQLVKKIKPDIVLSMPERVNVWTVLALAGTGIPVIVSERNTPALYPRSKLKRILRTIIYPVLPKGFVFQTKNASEYFHRSIQKKGVVLPNPLDLDRIPSKYLGERNKEIVAVGRLEEQKNFHLLIDAFSEVQKKFKNYKLVIYGEGSLANDLKYYADKMLEKESYQFPGKKSDVLEQIKKSAVFVLSSNYEGMPNVLIEAMAMGLPVVSTNCEIGGPSELIDQGINGILVSPKNKMELAEGIMSVISNEEQANKIANNAVLVREQLDINKIGHLWLNYFNFVLEKRK